MIRDTDSPCGHLWSKVDTRGKQYLAGVISLGIFGEVPVVIFPTSKQSENQPDYTIHVASTQKKNRKPASDKD